MPDIDKIFSIKEAEFESFALEVFRFQSENVPLYREFIDHLKLNPKKISSLTDIPFFPVEFFKTHKIIAREREPEIIFTSSGTTGKQSMHYIADLSLYEKSLDSGFRYFYGDPEKYCFLALLPSYRAGSSLVHMAEKLISISKDPDSGFYLDKPANLSGILQKKNSSGVPVIMLGVTFALTDLAVSHPQELQNVIFMETGGMKGRRKEMVREELHSFLKMAFHTEHIHSEYGMTELLSQAYSKSGGLFYCPPWMKILIRDIYDPLNLSEDEKTGAINIIDLANIYSCSFISTSDLGRKHHDGGFEVLGRIDYSDVRGCNLMII